MSVIELDNLSKSYRGVRAVSEISLRVEAGQVFGFLGPNGSGKTTTIGMMLGVITPTAGKLSLLGASAPKMLQAARRRIGATLEAPSFYPYLSGRDNLRIAANVKGATAKAVDDALDAVRLTERQRDRVETYSLGMKQRLAIASAMLGSPEIVILDEPTNGLDPEGMREIREIVQLLALGGATVFLSSHLLGEVERTCTHCAVLANGKVVASGSVNELTAGGSRVLLGADDLAALRAALAEHPQVKRLDREGDLLVADVERLDAAALSRFAAERGVYLSHLSFRQRTLEDAFFELTGRAEPPTNLR